MSKSMVGLEEERQLHSSCTNCTHNFVVVSYYTVGTPYAEIAHKYLMHSLILSNVKGDVAAIYSLGSWLKNTSYKATFVRIMMDKHPDKNIVFVDCDAEILKFPELFNNIPDEFDVAAHLLDRRKWYGNNDSHKELLSGTLFFRNNEHGRSIVDRWKFECDKYLDWDQKVLQSVLKDDRVYELPIEYCYINSLPNGKEPLVKVEDPVIIHHQVSRNLKRLIR